MNQNLHLKITKEQIEKVLSYELKHFSLHPNYENGECTGLEIVVEPVEKIQKIPIELFIEKKR